MADLAAAARVDPAAAAPAAAIHSRSLMSKFLKRPAAMAKCLENLHVSNQGTMIWPPTIKVCICCRPYVYPATRNKKIEWNILSMYFVVDDREYYKTDIGKTDALDHRWPWFVFNNRWDWNNNDYGAWFSDNEFHEHFRIVEE
jgi:hypothetical protein